MAKPYSEDLRKRVTQAIEAGHTHITVAKMFNIGRATVERYMARLRKSGNLAPDKFGGHMKHKLAGHADKVKSLIKGEPDQTLAELQARLEEAKIKVSLSAIDRYLKSEKITYKKNSVRHRAKTGRRR